MFVVFEGIDGVGKNTLIEGVYRWLCTKASQISFLEAAKIDRTAEPTTFTNAGKRLHDFFERRGCL